MVITPEYVLSLAQRIQDARASLAALETEWEGVFGPIASAARSSFTPTEPKPIRKRESRADGMPSLVSTLMNINDYPMDAAEIAEELGKPITSIRKVLQKMFSEGKIERAERGKYRAKRDASELPLGIAA